jgi:hypothetical protein
MKLFIWDNAVIVTADNLEKAREAACARLRHFDSLKQLVATKIPVEAEIPCVRILFTEWPVQTVNSLASSESALAKAGNDCLSKSM